MKTTLQSNFNGVAYHNYVACYGNTTRGRLDFGRMSNGTTLNRFGGGAFIEIINRNTGNWPNYYSWIVHTDDYLERSTLAEILDGTSNTLAFSETVQGHGGDLRGFSWWGGACHFETFLPPNSPQPDFVEQNCVSTIRLNPPCLVHTVTTNPIRPQTHAARSRHPTGVMAAMCDGSVRFYSNNVNLDTWRFLGSSRGGDVPGNF